MGLRAPFVPGQSSPSPCGAQPCSGSRRAKLVEMLPDAMIQAVLDHANRQPRSLLALPATRQAALARGALRSLVRAGTPARGAGGHGRLPSLLCSPPCSGSCQGRSWLGRTWTVWACWWGSWAGRAWPAYSLRACCRGWGTCRTPAWPQRRPLSWGGCCCQSRRWGRWRAGGHRAPPAPC